MADTLSLLRHTSLRLAKLWQADGTVADYDNAKFFTHETRQVASIRELSDLLTELETEPTVCVIRGQLKATPTDPDARANRVRKSYDYFDDQPLHAVMLDVDSYHPAMCDPFDDPQLAVEEFIITELPPQFHNAAYHWQLSNSFGHPTKLDKGLKVHLWFWLEHAVTSAQFKAWAKHHKLGFDLAVFQPVQPHYTSNPVMARGVTDPVFIRSGFNSGVTPGGNVELDMAEVVGAPMPTSRGERLASVIGDDAVASTLYDLGMVKSQRGDGGLNIDCPFIETHTGPSVESATVYYAPHTGGFADGKFKCLHAHCDGRSQASFFGKLGLQSPGALTMDDFENLDTPAPEAPAGPDDEFDDVSGEQAPALPASSKTIAKPERFAVQALDVFASGTPPTWIIKGVLPKAELGVMYGASGSGKSFMALDIAGAIARGIPWRGHRVKQGRVVYVAAEGVGGFRKRVQAYAQEQGISAAEVNMGVIASAPNLLERADALDVSKAIIAAGGADVVILDTFAQVMPGGNENAGEDVGKALAHCKGIHKATGALVLLVHHSGKDASKGARGWSGLRAAADVELEVERHVAGRSMRISKQKDGDDDLEWGFDLKPVEIGLDDDMDSITSCVVLDVPMPVRGAVRGGRVLGPVEKIVMDVLQGMFGVQTEGIEFNAVMDEALAVFSKTDDGLPATRRDRVRRAFKKLIADGFCDFDGETNCVGAPL